MKGEGKNQGFVTLFPHVLAACMQKGKKKLMSSFACNLLEIKKI
jgi:hypothetical protein